MIKNRLIIIDKRSFIAYSDNDDDLKKLINLGNKIREYYGSKRES
jgi:hypothetical protein